MSHVQEEDLSGLAVARRPAMARRANRRTDPHVAVRCDAENYHLALQSESVAVFCP